MSSAKGVVVPRKPFSQATKLAAFKRQDGKCANCQNPLTEYEADHKDADRSNNTLENCQLLCHACHTATFHTPDREAYLKDLRLLKTNIDDAIGLAIKKEANGTVLEAVLALVREQRAIIAELNEIKPDEKVEDLESVQFLNGFREGVKEGVKIGVESVS